MADNLTTTTTVSTVPSGTVIATDDAGAGGHVQIVKLAISTDGSATAIPAEATNGLDVDVTRVQGTVAVSAASLPLPSGASTLAEQQTQTTALQLIDDTVYTDGTGTPSKAIGIAGTDGTNPQIVKTDTSGELQVDVLTSALPSGAATSANQSTANTALSAIQTAVETLDNTVGGSELQVDVVGALPAGTNAIGKLAANSGVDIGDVDVTSFPSTVHSADYDTGAGTDTTLAFGIAVPASGGAAVVPGDATAGLKVDLGADNDVTVTGTVTANLAAGTNNIGDVDVLSIAAGDNNIGNVDIVTMPNVTLAAGTNTNEVVGDVAQDAAVAGNPLLVGGRASSAAPTDMSADGDSVYLWTTLKGALNVADAGGTLSIDDGAGNISIDDGGNIITVDGTVNAAQSGTWNINNISGTVSLPTGAATLAEQQTQTTALQLIDDTVFAEDVAAQAADKGIAVLAVRRDADTSLVGTDNDYANLQVDANGYLKVEIFDGGGSHTVDGTVTANLAAGTNNIGDVDILSIAAGDNNIGNVDIVTMPAVTNAGTFAVQVDGSALTALQKIDDPVLVDDAAFTPATSSVMMAGFEADEASIDSVNEGDAGAARMTLDRKVIVNPQPHTAGGLSIFRSLDLDETEEDVKTSAGQVYGWAVTNRRTSTLWLKFYNATAANVTVGTTTPVITWGIPGNSSDNVAANVMGAMGIAFDTAICVAATTGFADADTGAPGANELIVNIFYA